MRIGIQKIGSVDEKILSYLCKELNSIFSNVDFLVIVPEISIPLSAENSLRKQIHSTSCLKELKNKIVTTNVDYIIGIIDRDLFFIGLNFVFGEARKDWKTAIVSLHRLQPEFYGMELDESIILKRCIKEVVHEIGHLFGLSHCSNPECVMSFSEDIKSVDRKKASYCGKCWYKICAEF